MAVPTLDNPDEAVKFMADMLGQGFETVGVFDVGEDGIHVVAENVGQDWYATVTAGCYKALVDSGRLGPNVRGDDDPRGWHYHDFVAGR
jgi:hypothetical protein